MFAGFSSEALASRINDGKNDTFDFSGIGVGDLKIYILQAYLYQSMLHKEKISCIPVVHFLFAICDSLISCCFMF